MRIRSLFLLLLVTAGISAQTSSDIQLALQKLNVLGSVLYIAAHPDDENTAVIATFSKGRKYRSAYLSLTRGDGGQNLIGSEKGAEIGMIRTQELLEARKLDGGEQFFTRAIDFGYSKSAEESFNFWGRESILADVVWVIRKFRPDVIITRFPPDGYGGHGHHTASALLAREAFFAAADPAKFPEQLRWVQPWQTKRLFWNSWRPGQAEREKLLKVNTGEFNPLLGESYAEIAARARSMHKSQGFGVTASRGERFDYFDLVEGEAAPEDIFDGIDTSWGRIPGGKKIGELIGAVQDSFISIHPETSLPALVSIYKEMKNLSPEPYVELKKRELRELVKMCAGLWLEAISDDYAVAPGDSIGINVGIVNRSGSSIRLHSIAFPQLDIQRTSDKLLPPNQPLEEHFVAGIPENMPISQPYWLEQEPSIGLFAVDEQNNIGLAENSPSPRAEVTISLEGELFTYQVPVRYRWRDRVDGEMYRPLEVRPRVTLNLDNGVLVFPNDKSRRVLVKIQSTAHASSGEVMLQAPPGWRVDPASRSFSLAGKYAETTVTFQVTPPAQASIGGLHAVATINGKTFGRSLVEIKYPHIKNLAYFPPARTKVVRLNITIPERTIGYVEGSGDDIPELLRTLGYSVALLSDDDLESADLSRFDTIITGIRAYNTRKRLVYAQPRLLEYVRNGGTLLVQYNVTAGLLTEQIGPFPFSISHDRVSVEKAPMTILAPQHPLLNVPNKILASDFDGWVQERGLYFPNKWDEKYETLLSSHDPGETDKESAILYAKYGKGIFIYTGLSWFRQLPAGVPGAYRLFVNLISAEQ